MKIDKKEIQKMFEHYIARKQYNECGCLPGSQDDLFSAGEIQEAEKWLELFGVDLSYERIQPMVDETRKISAFEE